MNPGCWRAKRASYHWTNCASHFNRGSCYYVCWQSVRGIFYADCEQIILYLCICMLYVGDVCPMGSYCPQGSASPQLCHYIALLRVYVVGDICPMGSYCPQGSASPQLCQAGYYLNSTGNAAVSDCVQCSPGQYCSGGGNDQPVGQCDAGWYCPGGQADPRPTGLNCTLGRLDECRHILFFLFLFFLKFIYVAILHVILCIAI